MIFDCELQPRGQGNMQNAAYQFILPSWSTVCFSGFLDEIKQNFSSFIKEILRQIENYNLHNFTEFWPDLHTKSSKAPTDSIVVELIFDFF